MLANQSTSEVIAASLRSDIACGKIKPGTALRQENLAERFAVSRIPVREALLHLESEGLVDVFPNRGAFVSRLSADAINEITDLRVLIECDLMLQAAGRFEAKGLAILKAAEKQVRLSANTPNWVEFDRTFHAALYAPAAKPRQLALALSLRRELERYKSIYSRLPKQKNMWLADHRRIVAACSRRDAAAAADALREHIQSAGRFLVEKAAQDT
jgi:DNA-binding GntR family transcriptional regulator